MPQSLYEEFLQFFRNSPKVFARKDRAFSTLGEKSTASLSYRGSFKDRFRSGASKGLRSETVTQDAPQGVEQIFDPDLLALFPGSALVPNRDLTNDDFLLRKLGCYLRLKAEPLLLDGYALKQRPAEGFVACFHVG